MVQDSGWWTYGADIAYPVLLEALLLLINFGGYLTTIVPLS